MKAPPPAELHAVLETMVFSASGWRGIFAASGGEEDQCAEISPAHNIIIAAGAIVFADYVRNMRGEASPPASAAARLPPPPSAGVPAAPLCLILGTDTRPTGNAAADCMIRAFLGRDCTVHFTGIAAAPEIMAFSKQLAVPFAYISASHNPIGHNGLKFGVDGGVLEGGEAMKLIAALKNFLAQEDAIETILAITGRTDEQTRRRVYKDQTNVKQKALAAYRNFSDAVIGGEKAASKVLNAAAAGLAAHPLGIVCDFNGSARTLSIDKELFQSLGIGFRAINAAPGSIVHAIIPEGESLEPCRAFLEKLHAVDSSFTLGYVPDCDGDRGNLVVWNEQTGHARILEAQEVFALACVAELAQMIWTGELSYSQDGRPCAKIAIAVNGPTSMRIDHIAAAFCAEVFRAEVGEANVVNLARRLREQGYIVRILGEGSNGGNITHPAAVRDPAATLFALVKLFSIRDGGATGKGFFSIWKERAALAGCGTADSCSNRTSGFTMTDISESLPRFFTTGVSSPEAQLRVKAKDQRRFKQNYEAVFRRQWEQKKAALARWGIKDWEARACTGTEEKRNMASFEDAETGGLKIVFSGDGQERAFIWMRGSKTEPVFRIMADAEDAGLERELIAWQSNMVNAADYASCADRTGGPCGESR
jgi:phosphoglucomutase